MTRLLACCGHPCRGCCTHVVGCAIQLHAYCTIMCQSAVDWSRCNLVQDACIACAAFGLVFMHVAVWTGVHVAIASVPFASCTRMCVCDNLSFVLSFLSVLCIDFVVGRQSDRSIQGCVVGVNCLMPATISAFPAHCMRAHPTATTQASSALSPRDLALLMHRQLAHKHQRHSPLCPHDRLSQRSACGGGIAALVRDLVGSAACDAVLVLRVGRPRHHEAAPRPQQHLQRWHPQS